MLAELAGSGAFFGSGVAGVGDLDWDGIPDLIVGGREADEARGALWFVSLGRDGRPVRLRRLATEGLGLNPSAQFGFDFATLRDIDDDGFPELAVGAPGDDELGPGAGALWILFLGPGGVLTKSEKIFAPRVPGVPEHFAESFGSLVSRAGERAEDRSTLLVSSTEFTHLLFLLQSGRPRAVHALTAWAGGLAVREFDGNVATLVIGRAGADGGTGKVVQQRLSIVPIPYDDVLPRRR